MDSLFILKGLDQGRSFKLNYPVTAIGRDQHNDIVVTDREVSRFHADIILENGRFVLRDLKSSNGVFVNGHKVAKSTVIVKGDRIQLGQTLLLFSTVSAALPEIAGAGPHSSGRVVVSDQEQSRIVHTVKQDEGERLFRHTSEPEEHGDVSDLGMYLDLIYTMTRLVNETLDIETLLGSVLDLIFERIDVDRGCIMLLPSDDEAFVPAASRSRRSSTRHETITISRTILEYVRQNGAGVLTTDAHRDERWDSADSILRSNIREAICVPMKGRYGLVGVIYIDTARSPLALPVADGSESGASIMDEDQGSSAVDLLAPDDSARHSRKGNPSTDVNHVWTSRLKSDHLKLMAAIGHQAALAVEETRFHAAMLRTERLAAIGQTVAVVSHHVKNILQGMEGGSYMIEQGLKNHKEELFRKGWDMINRNRTKISDLVLDMLSFSKERQPQFALANLNQTVNEIVELMKGRCFNRKINILVYGLPNLPQFRFDQGQIHRALTNLVTNAVDAVQSKLLERSEHAFPEHDRTSNESCDVTHQDAVDYTGRIEVRIQAPSGTNTFVTITVDDNGPGIPQEIAENLFDPFVTCNKSGGTGLGLAVTNKIIQEHHGRLKVERSVLGGARFVVELPCLIDSPNESDYSLPSDSNSLTATDQSSAESDSEKS